MKKILFFAATLLLFFGCEDYNDQFDGYDDNTITLVKNLDYTLTDADYESMGGAPADYYNFSSSAPAADFIPDFLAEKYPSLDVNSSVNVTYTYYMGGLDYLDYLTNADSYELTTADYDSMGESSGQPGKYNNFDSSVSPDDYLPAFMATKYPNAVDGDLVLVTYKFYSGGVSNVSEYYGFDGSAWEAVEVDLPEGVSMYELTADDYDSMGEESGQPGRYNNFDSSTLPENYLPTFLELKFPYAMNGDKMAIIYMFYSGGTSKRATEYTKTATGWKAYSSTEARTDQFLKTSDGWLFDPSVIFTMNSEDYQIIVDYVKATYGEEKLDSYGTQEFYFGAGAYYENFDLRDGKYDTSFASGLEAAKAGISEGLLPNKFPNAVAQVSGVDVMYIVSFATYNGADGAQTYTYQCTKSGPNPEFTFVE
ncbi:MAG: hypothetical protein ACK5M7_13050 [Draconibacterium sp.]